MIANSTDNYSIKQSVVRTTNISSYRKSLSLVRSTYNGILSGLVIADDDCLKNQDNETHSQKLVTVVISSKMRCSITVLLF